MESLLSQIAESSADSGDTRRAYELIIRILRNITGAASRGEDLSKFKWLKAHDGSTLSEKVLGVHPLFRQLLEHLGFNYTFGRPPHVVNGRDQEYYVLVDGADVSELACSADVLEAVVESMPVPAEGSGSSTRQQEQTSPNNGTSHGIGPEQHTAVPSGGAQSSSNSTSPTCGRRPENEQSGSDLAELREEQRRRYEQRQSGRSSAAVSGGNSQCSESGEGDSSGRGWFWGKFSWGDSSNNNADDGNDRRSSGRQPPRGNRMMTLRDLPKPQRRG